MTTHSSRSGRLSGLAMLKALGPFLSPYRLRFALAGLALATAAAATLSIPYAFKELLDLGMQALAGAETKATLQDGRNAVHRLNLTFLALFGIACILGVATAARFYLVSWLGERVTADIREAVYRHVVRQSPAFFETAQTGEVLSRLTADTTLIQTLVGTSISMAVRNVLLFSGGMAMLFVTSASLSSLILLLLATVIAPIVWFGRRVRALSRGAQDRVADASALAAETLNAIPTIQAFVQEGHETLRFAGRVEQAFRTAVERNRARAVLTAMAIVLLFGAIVFVLWLGAQAVLEKRMSAGDLGQFMLYAAIVAGAIGALSEVFGDAQRAAGATERLMELLSLKTPIASPSLPEALRPRRSQGAGVMLEDVTFAYPSRPGMPSLQGFTLDVEPGETVALVGPSGAGKSTLFHLLLRFYDPEQGVIRLDGADIRRLDLPVLRTAIGIVPQDTVIFSANALENIRYGRNDATEAEVMAAARMAAAHDFIENLPEGYGTFLGERGVRLSGGQRQRIAIARALLKNPPLLLLDEATSALDAESERLVQHALDAAMVGRTTIVIAHRLATVQRADRIVVLEHGRIVETGTHASLVARGGLYASLAALQFGFGAPHPPA